MRTRRRLELNFSRSLDLAGGAASPSSSISGEGTPVDETSIRTAIRRQLALLTAVADEKRSYTEANPEYLRLHKELVGLTDPKFECFCPWGHVVQWWSMAAALGDPKWREHLAIAVTTFETATIGAPRPPKYPTFAYRRGGDPKDLPFKRSFARLEPHKQAALRAGIKNVLEVQGPNVADNKQVGEWINRGDGNRVLEFKVSVNASTMGYPKEDLLLRIGCCQTADGSAIVLLDCYDKGRDPNGQKTEIEKWVKDLKDFRTQEAAAKKAARRDR